ncbi:GNAT family N-acetyltransferase [Sutcliffiella horikoshii]|uniref:GNAT family N-acetyltransferase n=1 Tax=Sutcliffiella horikoshii TaxID=79883 RepID=A0AA94WLQ6_9BACI|nr:GNAT family N-acetyltransferase [Sutcliffiella horikoshii]TYS58097.1 GNAT family N-acetyltransferase [Sutcliffiella horikoshii]
MEEISIEVVDSLCDGELRQISELLLEVVNDGASIGFLPPFNENAARAYFETEIDTSTVLIVAKIKNVIVGSIQLHLATKPNASHRSEIAKLMTHPSIRRKGIGRLLMNKAEKIAMEKNRTLIILDTREGDPSNFLYTSLNYIEVGRIPKYAKSANGQLDATVYYYKNLI